MMMTLFAQITVRTPRELDALALQTYLLGAAAAIAFLLLAAIVSASIKFEGGSHPKDPGKRRLVFWGMLAASLVVFFLYNTFAVAPGVSPNLQSRFQTANATGAVIGLVTYLALGFVVSKIFSTGKLGNWFPSRR